MVTGGNWIDEFMDSWDDKRPAEIDLHEMDIIATESRALFKSLWKEMEKELAVFHDRGGDLRLQGYFKPSDSFVVRRSDCPAIQLVVVLEAPFIKFSCQSRSNNKSIWTDNGEVQLVIRADLHGRLQVRQNGRAFIDEAELSQFLLKPVLRYIQMNH